MRLCTGSFLVNLHKKELAESTLASLFILFHALCNTVPGSLDRVCWENCIASLRWSDPRVLRGCKLHVSDLFWMSEPA